jgi:hypothetical protein
MIFTRRNLKSRCRYPFFSTLLLSMLAVYGLEQPCQAQEASEATNFFEAANEYHFGPPGEPEFQLREQPIMTWSNPATYDQKGALFVWMKSGSPQVIGTLFDSVHSGMPRSTVELHALASTPVIGRYREVEFWRPQSSGLQFIEVGADMDLASAPQRKQLQLRQISRQFRAELTEPDGSKLPLRLLPTPILSYEPKSETCTDGAIFAFAATGTDPDVLLIIENRKIEGRFRLAYAFARFHFRELVAFRAQEAVWKAEAKTEMTRSFRTSPMFRDSPYLFFRVK